MAAALSAAAPGRHAVSCRWGSAYVSGTVISHAKVILVFESAGEYRQWIGVDRLPSIPHRREDWIRPWCQPDLQQTFWVVH